jgi:ATP-binding cassette, subfamily B, bacterial MsbA
MLYATVRQISRLESKPLTQKLESTQQGYTSTRSLMARLIREHVRQYKGLLYLAVFFMAVMAGATSVSALLMKPVVNDVFIRKDSEILWYVGGAIVATFVIKGLANYAQSVVMSIVGLRIIADLQNRLFAHLARMDLRFFQQQSTGALISRFTVDINSIRTAVSTSLTTLGKDLFMLIGLVGVMFYQDWELSLVALIVFPLAIYPIARLGKRVRKVVANTQNEMGLFTALLSQTFQGIRVVKAYRMQDYEAGRIGELVTRIYGLNLKASRTQALASPIMETLGGISVASVIVYGGYRVIGNQTDPGSFFSFITALLMAYEPAKRLANLNTYLQIGLAGAERMYDLLDTEPSIAERADAKAVLISKGAINLDSVTFEYEADSIVLDSISIDIPAGKTVALVGPSGAGKSTVFNLIPRFYDVESGTVTIDGVDVRDMTFSSLHQSIALVSQEVTLFDDTIRANIAYGRAGASDEDIEQAARRAAAHDFVTSLPAGYDTIVGEHGLKLSGGQRQRLAIARAMLKNAPVLLLDEATSALDTEAERKVQDALEELIVGRTAVVIAHRLSTIVNADLIYVIDKGRVVEQGTHDELIEAGGHYSRLYDLQFRESEAGSPELLN